MNIGIRTLILFLLGIIGTLALTYGTVYSIPDLVEVRYGLPFTWGTNVLSTIVGPVDVWRVDPLRLAVDVALWFLVLIAASVVLHYRRGRSKEKYAQLQPVGNKL
jgi:hypothetical protein